MFVTEFVVWVVFGYALCGMLFGIPFVAVGVGLVDEAARATSVCFRLIILPGVVAFWPLMAGKWLAVVLAKGKP